MSLRMMESKITPGPLDCIRVISTSLDSMLNSYDTARRNVSVFTLEIRKLQTLVTEMDGLINLLVLCF